MKGHIPLLTTDIDEEELEYCNTCLAFEDECVCDDDNDDSDDYTTPDMRDDFDDDRCSVCGGGVFCDMVRHGSRGEQSEHEKAVELNLWIRVGMR